MKGIASRQRELRFHRADGCAQFEIGNSVPRRSQGRKLAMISGVSGVGLREISSKSTVTVRADATHRPSENTT
jgi:hypothetical protein